MSPSGFRETASKNILNKEQQELLSRKISDLSLKIQGTRLEALISELYQELEKAGVSFKPKTYLANTLQRGLKPWDTGCILILIGGTLSNSLVMGWRQII